MIERRSEPIPGARVNNCQSWRLSSSSPYPWCRALSITSLFAGSREIKKKINKKSHCSTWAEVKLRPPWQQIPPQPPFLKRSFVKSGVWVIRLLCQRLASELQRAASAGLCLLPLCLPIKLMSVCVQHHLVWRSHLLLHVHFTIIMNPCGSPASHTDWWWLFCPGFIWWWLGLWLFMG